jgi:hypothetical protein
MAETHIDLLIAFRNSAMEAAVHEQQPHSV